MATMQSGVLTESDDLNILLDHRAMVERVVSTLRHSQEVITLNDMADIAGLSPYYFTRVFRSIAGIPPGEFAAALRFQRAKELLLKTPASITDICFDIGYGSLGTFSSRFRTLTSVSPAEFRQLATSLDHIDLCKTHHRFTPARVENMATISGTISLPEGMVANTYVGLFPAAISAKAPVTGMMVANASDFRLHQCPIGSWVLLAAAVPSQTDMLSHLLLDDHTYVCNGGIVHVTAKHDHIIRDLTFRRLEPLDPPLLTALPALLRA